MYFLYLFVWNKKVPIQTNTEKSTKRAHFCFWLCFAFTLKNKTPTKKTYFGLLPPSKIKHLQKNLLCFASTLKNKTLKNQLILRSRRCCRRRSSSGRWKKNSLNHQSLISQYLWTWSIFRKTSSNKIEGNLDSQKYLDSEYHFWL